MSFCMMIAAVYALLYYLLRKEQSGGFYRGPRAEGRGENVKGRGFKICQGFIYLIVYYLFFPRAREVY